MLFDTVIIAALVVSFSWLLLFLTGLRRVLAADYVSPDGLPESQEPPVCVVIPARNEEHNIGRCLDSILAQDYGDLSVVVADDSSTDGTADVVESRAAKFGKVKLFSVDLLPEGWCGKAYAMHTAANSAAREFRYILFTDADTVHSTQSVRAAVATAIRTGADVVSFLPKLKCVTFWEKVLMPSVGSLIAFFYDPRKVNDPARKESAFANGQYLLVRSEAYFENGGHEPVRDRVLEDVDYARYMKARGMKIFVATALGVFETRMYGSLREIMDGWTKNFFGILGYRKGAAAFACLLSLVMSTFPFLGAIAGVGGLAASACGPVQAAVLLGCYVFALSCQTALRAIGKVYPAYSVFAPAAGVLTAYLIFRAMTAAYSAKGVGWKGRSYTVRGGR